MNLLKNNQQCTSMEETKEPPISMGGETEKELHYEDQKSLPSDFEKYEETSHDNEKYYLETIEYHSKTHSIVDVDQRESTDGFLNYEGVATDGWSQIYFGDIEIIL